MMEVNRTQALLGVLGAGILAVLAQVYSIDLKIAENKKYLVLIDAIQKDVDSNSHRLDRIEGQMLDKLNLRGIRK